MSTPEYSFSYQEVVDEAGIPGQGKDNPASVFSWHYVVLMNGIYWDPSYGTGYVDNVEFGQNISGFCLPERELLLDEAEVGLDLNKNGNNTDLGVKVRPCLVARKGGGVQFKDAQIAY